jgi:hypothetical protein
MQPQERFWYGIITMLLVGAATAKKIGLVDFDLRTLKDFLLENLEHMRSRTSTSSEQNSLTELLSSYLRDRGDRTLVLDTFPGPMGARGRPKEYLPEIISSPRSDRVHVVLATKDKKVRFSTNDFHAYAASKGKTGDWPRLLRDELGGNINRTILGAGTRYASPRCFACELDTATWADASSHERTPGSSTSEQPED